MKQLERGSTLSNLRSTSVDWASDYIPPIACAEANIARKSHGAEACMPELPSLQSRTSSHDSPISNSRVSVTNPSHHHGMVLPLIHSRNHDMPVFQCKQLVCGCHHLMSWFSRRIAEM